MPPKKKKSTANKKKSGHTIHHSLIRIGRGTHEVTTVHDADDNILHKMVKPLMLEFQLKDLVQVIVGATLLAIPVAYTEEVWKLAHELTQWHILGIMVTSLTFTGLFSFYTYYKRHFASHYGEFFKRVISTYLLSLLVCGIILFLINRVDTIDWLITFNRMVLLGFPASMSATVADMLK